MTTTFKLYRGQSFLGSRGTANGVRTAAEDALRLNPVATVILDFDGVEGVSHSFTDELLAPLSELLGPDMKSRVLAINCDPQVWESMTAVCKMHGLTMPATGDQRLSA